MIAIVFALAIGLGSAVVYLLRRKWIDAALALIAGAALAALVGELPMPADSVPSVTLDASDRNPRVGDAMLVKLKGDGLRAAQWHDLPARKLEWTPPADDVLRLDFPRVATPGRMFRLTATMTSAASRRLQLLAENGQVIAEAAGKDKALTVEWLPPVAETLVLKARLLDAAGKVIDQGPVPVQVREAAPLQVQGRLGSPSFDARALNTLLANSNAVLDWQVTLGKTVTRSETARVAMAAPELLVVDAAYMERLAAPARAALLARAASGAALMVLGSNASDTGFWSRSVQLSLKEQAEAKASGTPLALLTARFNPPGPRAGAWTAVGDRIWMRPWDKGRIVWIGASEWHRYAISEPRALGMWWQDTLDRAGIRRSEELAWIEPEEMALPGQRLAVCAQGVTGTVGFPQLGQRLAWQQRPDRADAACVAVWPSQPGWLKVNSQGAAPAQMYVYAPTDWPLWQKAQRRDATARYAARTLAAPARSTTPLPAWPFALLFAVTMLLLWWRERRVTPAGPASTI